MWQFFLLRSFVKITIRISGVTMINPIARIGEGARILTNKGSLAERLKIREQMRKNFASFIDDKFEKQGFITVSDVNDYYKNSFKGVDITVSKPKSRGYSGQLDFKYSPEKKSILGFVLELPFKGIKKAIKKDAVYNVKTAIHEDIHFGIYSTEPKYLVQWTKGILSEKKFNSQSKFYDKIIYDNEFQDQAEKINPKRYKSERIKHFKSLVGNYFNKKHFTQEEKIDVLRRWKYYIKEEICAFKGGTFARVQREYPIKELSKELSNGGELEFNETFNSGAIKIDYNSTQYQTVEEKIKGLKQFVKSVQKTNYKRIIETLCFFPEKLKIVEQMLREEIQNARTELAKTRQQ